ncbi:hypothetical protein GF406_12065 [candidate division KSB1 bacterium]|nr:hypothetical protein [candidate division KSB1 bacterium]
MSGRSPKNLAKCEFNFFNHNHFQSGNEKSTKKGKKKKKRKEKGYGEKICNLIIFILFYLLVISVPFLEFQKGELPKTIFWYFFTTFNSSALIALAEILKVKA